MKNPAVMLVTILVAATFIFSRCGESQSADGGTKKDTALAAGDSNGGFGSQVKWGEHLVTISGCNDCHTPRKMTPNGPEADLSLALSGHPAKLPPPDVDRKAMESKGLAVTDDLTSWVGPWGISFAANITSDSTGIGNWSEGQFLLAMREGKWKGIAGNRQLLPPMPWNTSFKYMTEGELKAIFAYLKTTKPVQNIAPPAQPPVSAAKRS